MKREPAGTYRPAVARDLRIDLLLTFLTEGINTYSIEVEVAVNGIRRVATIDKAMLGDQQFPLTAVFAGNPDMIYEESPQYPQTQWLSGPQPCESP